MTSLKRNTCLTLETWCEDEVCDAKEKLLVNHQCEKYQPVINANKLSRIVIRSEFQKELKNFVSSDDSFSILSEVNFNGLSIYKIKQNITFDSSIPSNLADSLREINSTAVIGSKLIKIEIEDSRIEISDVEDMNMDFWEQFKLFRNNTVRAQSPYSQKRIIGTEKSDSVW